MSYFFLLLSNSPKLDPLSHRLGRNGDLPAEDSIREFYTSTVFEHYRFSGTLGETINDLMDDSLKYTPDNFTQIGGFLIDEKGSGGIKEMPIEIDVRGLNALEVINELCRQADCRWTLGEYGGILLSR